jgi:hypothetical protein
MDYLEPVTKWMEWIIGACATGFSAESVDDDSGFSAEDADEDYDILTKYIISYLILQNNTEVPPAPYLHPRLNLFQFQKTYIILNINQEPFEKEMKLFHEKGSFKMPLR